MKKNMSMTDRLVRTTIAVAIIVLYLAHQITGTAAAILGVIAVIFLATSSVGVCLVYKVLGISTLREGSGDEHHGGLQKGAH